MGDEQTNTLLRKVLSDNSNWVLESSSKEFTQRFLSTQKTLELSIKAHKETTQVKSLLEIRKTIEALGHVCIYRTNTTKGSRVGRRPYPLPYISIA